MSLYNYKELNPTAQKTAAYAIREAVIPNIEREIGQFIESAHCILGNMTPVRILDIELTRPHSKPRLKYRMTAPKRWNVTDRQIHFRNWYNLKYEEYNEGLVTATGNHSDSYILRRLSEHPIELTGKSIADTVKYAIKEFERSVIHDLTDEDELNAFAVDNGMRFDVSGIYVPE